MICVKWIHLQMNLKNVFGLYLRNKEKFSKFTPFFTSLHTPPPTKTNGFKSLNRALRVIDIVSPKPTRVNNLDNHLQLIQDFLQTHSKNCIDEKFATCLTKFDSSSQNPFDQKHSFFAIKNEDPTLVIKELHGEGLRVNVVVLSPALSACGHRGDIYCGTQLQCLSIKEGFSVNVYVGSSLISMYSKFADLCSACKVFDDMPLRNIVSWTALISGFAQDFQVNMCLEFYSRMRKSTVEPNDFTFTILLTACVDSGSLIHGKVVHCQAILWGVDSYIHVANTLISMYCKCGNVGDAFCVFETMQDKDIVSWNSMIAGYALHGLAPQAIDLFEELKKLKIKPNDITFLGVLSSCRHVGLVDQGRVVFNSMLKYGVKPNMSHYSCIVDLLGRAGLMEEARNFILKMPIKPNAIIWGSLLSSCRLHDNVWIGIEAAESRLAIEPSCAATHVQLAKLYARVGLWDQVAKVWKSMKDTEVRTKPGYSWIEIGNVIYGFSVNDTSNSRMNEILFTLNCLMDHLAVSHSIPDPDEESYGEACTIESL